MKKYLLSIILVVIGIILLCNTEPKPQDANFLRGIGAGMFLVAIIWFIIVKRKQHDTFDHFQKYHTTDNDKCETSQYRDPEISKPFTATTDKQMERKAELDDAISVLRQQTTTKILVPDDVPNMLGLRMNNSEHMYICQNTYCPLIGSTTSIWDIKEKIDAMSFSEEQIITLFKHGSEYLIERLNRVCDAIGWKMPDRVFDYLLSSDKMKLLEFPYYTKDQFSKLIDQLGPYERFGYRIEPIGTDEQPEGSIGIAKEDMSYYEDTDTDIVYIAEQHFSEDDNLRTYAFEKLFDGPCQLTETIGRLDSIKENEAKNIFERNDDDEIKSLLDRSDSDEIVDYIPPKHAIKIVLGVISSEYSEYIHENYNFEKIDESVWLEIIEELTPDELAGFRIHPDYEDEESEGTLESEDKDDIPYYAEGDHDIMKLIEDHANDDEDLRKAALKKVMTACCIADVISDLDGLYESEVQIIMEQNIPEAVEAVLDREDSNDIIVKLPEDVAIKIRLGLIYPNASDNVGDNYTFNNSGIFMKVINELSPEELLGYVITSEDTDNTIMDLATDEEIFIDNDADYDIIKFIEDEMGDDAHLRALAFAKICNGKNLTDAIARWDGITDTEVDAIIKRGYTEEIEALMERNDFDDSIKAKMPDNFIIRGFLTENNDSINEEFHERMDDKKFRQKMEQMAATLPNDTLEDHEDDSVDDLPDSLIIKITTGLIDPDDHENSLNFDKDDVCNEFVDRMENNEEFQAVIQKMLTLLM